MKYDVVHFDYHAARTDNPLLFTVEGTPTSKAEWDSVGGKTRQTMTLAEIEAAGLTLPAVFASSTATVQKRADILTAERDAAVNALASLKLAIGALLK